jgi:amino acid transporter
VIARQHGFPDTGLPSSGTGRPACAGGQLHRKLSSFGVLLLTLSCLSPVFSIYGIGADVLQYAGTGAAGLFLVGIGVALVWAMVYAELGSAYPYAGGDYVGVGSILGPWAGFASLTFWAVTTGPFLAYLAKIIATYVGVLTPAASPLLIAYVALVAAVAIALLAVRTSAIVTGIFLGIEMLAVLVLIIAGLGHPIRSLGSVLAHPVALNAAGTMVPVGIAALALGGVSAAYATTGGNQAIAFGEELTQPHRHMGRVILLAGMIGAFATALPVIAVVIGANNLPAILKSSAPLSAFISSIAGRAAGLALSAGVALAVFNALIAQIMFAGRLFFSLGRDEIFHQRVNTMLATVHGASGAPRAATLVVGLFAGACCLLDSHVLLVVSSGTVVYSLALVCCAVLVGRKTRQTGQIGYWRSPLFPLAPILGLCLAVSFAAADLLDADVGRPSILVLGGVIGAGLLWHHFVLRRRAGGWAPRLA